MRDQAETAPPEAPSSDIGETTWAPATFTSAEFERLIGEAALSELGRFELRGGRLIRMNAQYVPHGRVKTRLSRRLEHAIELTNLGLEVVVESTVRFAAGFSPLPDIVAFEPFVGRKAIPGEAVRLIIEVADSTLGDDLGAKREDYAKAGLPEYWVADLNARCIHLFAAPLEGAFTRAGLARFGEPVAAMTLPGVLVETSGLE